MNTSSLFIGSSSEGLDFARAVRDELNEDAEITLWKDDFFEVGRTLIESLMNSVSRFDFAILVLTPDDWIRTRNQETFSPRDNVLFELGLFMGKLGPARTFIISQKNGNIKIPSDLSGVNTATYSWPREDNNHRAAVGAACNSIRKAIRELGPTDQKIRKQLDAISLRQQVTEEWVTETQKKVDWIFANTMSEEMFLNLKKLATGRFGHFKTGGHLHRELRHLRDIGYITTLVHIQDLPPEGDDLSEFVKVTAVGQAFVKFRLSLEQGNAAD